MVSLLVRRRGELSKPTAMNAVSVLLLLPMVFAGSGCAKKAIAEFKRPPATATLPPSEPEPEVTPEEEVAEAPQPAESEQAPDPASPPPKPRTTAPAKPAPADPPAPAPRETQLAEEMGTVDPETRAKVDRADALLGAVDARPLSQGERQQASSARGFIAQAKKAIREGDERRALVLLNKGLLLVEDLERATRP